MLNASRHHWYSHVLKSAQEVIQSGCSTPRGITGTLTRVARSPPREFPGAQRLAASLVLSHGAGGFIPSVFAVLNASRHHWYSHPSRHAPACHQKSAQRLAASLVLSLCMHWLFYSLFASVLNASRHHWYSHLSRTILENSGGKCSTPRGITGTLTITMRGHQGIWYGAQRLAASLVLSRRQSCRYLPNSECAQRLAASLVLSPVTQHSFSIQPPLCAQRLAASLVLSPIHCRSPSTLSKVLNASRHHWYSHDKTESLSPIALLGVLNASRHHWYSHQ